MKGQPLERVQRSDGSVSCVVEDEDGGRVEVDCSVRVWMVGDVQAEGEAVGTGGVESGDGRGLSSVSGGDGGVCVESEGVDVEMGTGEGGEGI